MTTPAGPGRQLQPGHQIRDREGRLWIVIRVDRKLDTATLSTPGHYGETIVINRSTGEQVQ